MFPPQRMDIGLALFSVEEVVQMREYRIAENLLVS
jgi:hypothetical protein